jgi:hypothetical protein
MFQFLSRRLYNLDKVTHSITGKFLDSVQDKYSVRFPQKY